MFFIDIAVPRDIDPKVDNLENAYLFTVDNLQEIVQANLAQRNREAEKAEEIIDKEIGQFYKWLSSLEVTPTIVALRTRFDEIRKAGKTILLVSHSLGTVSKLCSRCLLMNHGRMVALGETEEVLAEYERMRAAGG